MIFIAGMDYARGGSDLTNPNQGDDFSLASWKVEAPKRPKLVNIVRHTGISADQAAAVIHKHNNVFNYKWIIADPGGGGVFVRDSLRKPVQDTGSERFPVTPIIQESDVQMIGIGNPILKFFKRGEDIFSGPAPYGMAMDDLKSESALVNKAHEVLRLALEKKIVELPKLWEGWGHAQVAFQNADQMRKWLNMQNGLHANDRVRAEIDLAILQLIGVDREADKDGLPKRDQYGYYSFKSKRKKDSAYAILYGYFGVWAHTQIEEQIAQFNSGPDDFVVSSDSVNTYNP